MKTEVVRKVVSDALNALLKPLGFKRSGQLFSRQVHDVVQLVQLQGSTSSVVGDVRCTVNVAIWIPKLAPEDKANVAGAHWRERIGFLCAEQTDVWWRITSEEALREASSNIVRRVELHALPALDALPSASSMLALWRTGVSPGLTTVQAQRFAGVLERAGA